jgi:hypothetical protein
LVDGLVKAGTDRAPYDLILDTTSKVEDGQHSIHVRAWNKLGKAGDSKPITVTVKNAIAEPAPLPIPEPPAPVPTPTPIPPTPEPAKRCSITAPASVSIPRNGTGVIPVTLHDLTGPTEVRVIVPDGQVTLLELSWMASATSSTKQFQVRVKKQSRTITFQSGCGSVQVRVNVT